MTRLLSFGLFLVIVAFQLSSCGVFRKLQTCTWNKHYLVEEKKLTKSRW